MLYQTVYKGISMTELEKTMFINENMTIEDAMRVIDQGGI